MNLVWIFVAIGAGGLVMLVCYGIWLWRKATNLFSELAMLGRRGEELAALLEQVRIPELDPAAPQRASQEVTFS